MEDAQPVTAAGTTGSAAMQWDNVTLGTPVFADIDDCAAKNVVTSAPEAVSSAQAACAKDQGYGWKPTAEGAIILSPSLGYSVLNNVRVCNHGLILDAKGRVVSAERIRAEPWRIGYQIQQTARLLHQKRIGFSPEFRSRRLGTAILAVREGIGCYGHWLLDMLPALEPLRASGLLNSQPIVVTSDTPGWAIAMLRAFYPEAGPVEMFDPGRETLSVGRLFVGWRPRNQFDFHPAAGNIFDRLVGARSGHGKPWRKLFVSRRKFGKGWSERELLNYETVEALFAAAGFDIVYPETLSFGEQITVFSEAQTVAGECGSGLHNTVFSLPGTNVLEIAPESYTTPIQWAIAILRKHNHITLRLPVLTPSSRIYGGTYEVPEAAIHAALEKLNALGR